MRRSGVDLFPSGVRREGGDDWRQQGSPTVLDYKFPSSERKEVQIHVTCPVQSPSVTQSLLFLRKPDRTMTLEHFFGGGGGGGATFHAAVAVVRTHAAVTVTLQGRIAGVLQ